MSDLFGDGATGGFDSRTGTLRDAETANDDLAGDFARKDDARILRLGRDDAGLLQDEQIDFVDAETLQVGKSNNFAVLAGERDKAALRQPAVSSYFRWGALTLLPVEHPLRVMQYMTRRFVAAGGRILSLTWHSSEMMPGGAPHMPDEGHVTRFLEKIKKYIEWLPTIGDLRSVTMQEIRRELPTCPAPLPPATADWSVLPTESFSDSPP